MTIFAQLILKCAAAVSVRKATGQKKPRDDSVVTAASVPTAELGAWINLHARKLELYPEAFAITERLSRRYILAPGCSTPCAELLSVRDELIAWNVKCGPIQGYETLLSFRTLLGSLSCLPNDEGLASRRCRNLVWRNKNWFRGCIKAELQPLVSK